jgi:hypothetical protein
MMKGSCYIDDLRTGLVPIGNGCSFTREINSMGVKHEP